MRFIDGIQTFPSYIRWFILSFTIALSFGYFSGFKFLVHTTDLGSEGIEQNYMGNEDDEEAEVMRFKKSEREILTTIHGHAVSFSLIFLSVGVILISLPIHRTLKKALMIEPFVSIILTFGGIWLLWAGITWLKYVVVISGILLTLSFAISALLIIRYTLLSNKSWKMDQSK